MDLTIPISLEFHRMRDPDHTRQRLLKVARQQFAKKGLAGARVDEIARKAGINKQALYYYFGSKEDLFREALESGYRQFRERDRELDVASKSPEKALAKVIGVTYDDLHHSSELIAMVMDENLHKGRHLNRSRVRQINAPLIKTIKDLLAHGEREGVFRAGVDPEHFYISLMSLSIFCFSHAYTISASVGRNLKTKAAIRERRAQIIELLLASLRPR